MYLLRHLHAGGRWVRRRLAPLGHDRGDSPVPSAIIIAGMAVLAIAVLVALYSVTSGFLADAPTELPDPGFGDPGGD
jgi:hypothetical protein